MKRRAFIAGAAGTAAVAAAGAWGWRAATGSMADYRRYAAALRAPLADDPTPQDLVRYASLAPNGHNTQPWRFRLGANGIAIAPDLDRATPVVDPDDHHLYVSLGCAAETLVIAAAATGRPGALTVAADGGVRYDYTEGAARPDPLFAAIPVRQSTRADFDGAQVAPADLAALEAAAAMPGVDLVLLTERAAIDGVRDLVLEANTAQVRDPAFREELKHWLRFNPAAAMAQGDGLFAPATGNPVLPTPLGGPAFDLFFDAATENARYARQIDTAAGIAVFFGEKADPAHWVSVGRACQRFALAATSRGLRTSFLNQPVEVARLRPALAALLGAKGRRPDLVMRFGRGPTLAYSPRRPVAAVLA